MRTLLRLTALLGLLAAGLLNAGVASADPTEDANKALVTQFFNMVFTDHNVAEAFNTYTSKDFIEHHVWPNRPDLSGRQGAIEMLSGEFKRDPAHKLAARKVVAQGEMVSVHSAEGDADIDIFRVVKGVIVEHWDG